MFRHDQPNVVVFGDSNTWAFGPAWVNELAARGWDRDQLVLSYRSGSKPRHWLTRDYQLYQNNYGPLITSKITKQKVTVLDALSPLTQLVIIGLGGNMMLNNPDIASNGALVELVEQLAPYARILWRGPPPSTAKREGQVATSKIRRSRYRKNGAIKRALAEYGFVQLGEQVTAEQTRIYLDVLALHACGPAPRVRPLATGRDIDFRAEQVLVTSLMHDPHARREVAVRGPWANFVQARDGLPSHVPRKVAPAFVEIVAARGALDTGEAVALPLEMVVIDDNALIREGAPRFRKLKDARLEPGRIVRLDHWQGRYGHVSDAESGAALGWTARLNLELAE